MVISYEVYCKATGHCCRLANYLIRLSTLCNSDFARCLAYVTIAFSYQGNNLPGSQMYNAGLQSKENPSAMLSLGPTSNKFETLVGVGT